MDDSDAAVTIATYNIKIGIQQGLAAVGDVIARHASPDILAVQEIGHHWLMGPEGDSPARLSKTLGLHHYEFVPTLEEAREEGAPARYGHALFSRWPLGETEVVDLPRREDEPRRLLRSRIDTPADNTLEVLSTHLSHLSGERPDQGLFLMQWLDEHPLKTDVRFLLGDLNAPPSESWMGDFLKRWVDPDDDKQRPTFPAHDPKRRIDYVLGDGAELVSSEVPSEQDASDHRPVITEWLVSS